MIGLITLIWDRCHLSWSFVNEGHGILCFTERPRMKRIERMLVALAIGFPSTIDPPPRESGLGSIAR